MSTLDDVNAALDVLDALPEQVRAEAERRAIPLARAAEEALVSRFDLSRWLNGRVQPSTTTCRRLAAWLDTSRTHDDDSVVVDHGYHDEHHEGCPLCARAAR